MLQESYVQGSTIQLTQTYRDGTGALADPTSPEAILYDPGNLGSPISAPLTTRLSVGQWVGTYTLSSTATLGTWFVLYQGTLNSVTTQSDLHEFVVLPAWVQPTFSSGLAALVGMVRISIRDNGSPQAFPDVIDNTLATPAIVANNSPELSQFVTASLAEYSRYRPLKRPFTLNIEAGTATYNLPADWIGVDLASFNRSRHPNGNGCDRRGDDWGYGYDDYGWGYDPFAPVQVSGPSDFIEQHRRMRFDWYNDLQQVILSAPPLTSYALTFDYFAQQQPSTIPAQWIDAALAPACERALRALCADQTTKLQQYKMANGKLEVDNRTIKDALLKQADTWHERFRQEIVMRPHATIG